MVVLEAFTYQVERIAFRVKTTSFHIDTPTTSQLCSNAGLMLLVEAADRVGVADAIDTALGDRQNPSLVHTIGHTRPGHEMLMPSIGPEPGVCRQDGLLVATRSFRPLRSPFS